MEKCWVVKNGEDLFCVFPSNVPCALIWSTKERAEHYHRQYENMPGEYQETTFSWVISWCRKMKVEFICPELQSAYMPAVIGIRVEEFDSLLKKANYFNN